MNWPLIAPDADGAQRTGPGNVADHQRGGGADDAEHVRIIFAVGAEQNALNLHFVVPALGKERTDGTVGQRGR